MQGSDYAKAVGAAVLVLALDMLLVTIAIFLWFMIGDPGKTPAYYQAMAPHVAAWVTPVTGALLFLVIIWQLGKRRPDRNPMVFAIAAFVAYLLIDLAMLAFGGAATLTLGLIMAIKFGGALAGGLLAARSSAHAPQA